MGHMSNVCSAILAYVTKQLKRMRFQLQFLITLIQNYTYAYNLLYRIYLDCNSTDFTY